MHILFLTARFPYPPEKGDQIRPYHQIQEISRRHRVSLLSLCEERPSDAAMTEMKRHCHRVEIVMLSRANRAVGLLRAIPTGEPLQVGCYRHPAVRSLLRRLHSEEHFDLAHAVSIRSAGHLLFPKVLPTVVDFIDCLSLNFRRRAQRERGLMRQVCLLEAKRLQRYEQKVCRAMDAGVVVSAVDAEEWGSSKVQVNPLGMQAASAPREADQRDPFTLVFTGNMSYFPNDDAAQGLITEILPRIREQIPQARACIVGRRPSPALLKLADNPRVVVTGEVARVEDYLERAAIAVCPMRSGSGMQFKVLEAMANAVPVVATPFALGGLAAEQGKQLVIAESAEAFAQAVITLLKSPQQRDRIGRSGYELVRSRYSWAASAAQLEAVYEAVLAGDIKQRERRGVQDAAYTKSGND